jgi:hypothetical protein
MGVMHTDMNREIPTAAQKPPTINLSHITFTLIPPSLPLYATYVPEAGLSNDLFKNPNKKPRLTCEAGLLKNNSGGFLLSHAVTHVVSSALPGLTSEFEMGSGVAPAP